MNFSSPREYWEHEEHVRLRTDAERLQAKIKALEAKLLNAANAQALSGFSGRPDMAAAEPDLLPGMASLQPARLPGRVFLNLPAGARVIIEIPESDH